MHILATDIDSKVLQKARTGVYAQNSISQLSHDDKTQFFYKGKGAQTGRVRVVDELRKMVQFEPLNLMSPNWCVDRPVDVIFCRNVMIYFDRPTQRKILAREKVYLNHQYLLNEFALSPAHSNSSTYTACLLCDYSHLEQLVFVEN